MPPDTSSALPGRRAALGAAWLAPVIALAAAVPLASASLDEIDARLTLNRYLSDGAIVEYRVVNATAADIPVTARLARPFPNGASIGSRTPQGWTVSASPTGDVYTATALAGTEWRSFALFIVGPPGSATAITIDASAPGYATTKRTLPLQFP